MKKMLSLVPFFMVSIVSYAQDSLVCKISPSSEEAKAIIALRHLEGRNALIEIRDAEGKIVYEEQVEGKKEYAKIYNFEPLTNGSYTFNYEVEGVERTCTLNLENNKIQLENPHKLQGFYQPIQLQLKENQAFLFVDNETKQSLAVLLFNKNGELVYSDNFFSNEDYRKRFNMQNLAKGEYTLSIQKGNTLFTEQVVIK
jgi:hypothetical protein